MLRTDFLIIGSGIAGLTFAVKTARRFPEKTITIITKAKDGYDARADVEIEFIDLHKSNLMKVVGVECVIVPKKYIWKINEEFPINEQKGLIKIQADLEKADIVRKLELFEDEKPDPDLSKFIDDDQSDIDK